jgi:hypothetical protein
VLDQSLKLAIDLFSDSSPLEEHLLYIEKLGEERRDVALANESHKKRVKWQYDQFVFPSDLLRRRPCPSLRPIQGSPGGRKVQTHVVQSFHCERDIKEGNLSSG